MKLGLRPILLLVAIVLFVVAAISDQNLGRLAAARPRRLRGRLPRRPVLVRNRMFKR